MQPSVAASAAPMDSGRGSTFAAGTTQYCAIAPWCSSVSSVRRGSKVSSPRQPGVAITGYMTTGEPSSSSPAPSQPRIIGNWSGLMPTPRSVQMSCRFSDAACIRTRTKPSGTSGSGRSPTSRADSGSSVSGRLA